jgi:membrane protein YdbS with pleckstrin-like domain
MDFNNNQVDHDLLPNIEDLKYAGLQKDYKKLSVLFVSIFNFLLIAAFSAFLIIRPIEFPDHILFLAAVLIAIRIIWSYLSVVMGFKYKSYALRDKDIIYRSGWLWRQSIIIPFNRVQHIQVDQGPLERKFKLAKLKIFTAGGNSSDISIPGLRPEKAEKIKQFIVSKTALDEEE